MKTEEFKYEIIKSKIDYWIEQAKKMFGLCYETRKWPDMFAIGYIMGKIDKSFLDIKDFESTFEIRNDNSVEIVFNSISQNFSYKVIL